MMSDCSTNAFKVPECEPKTCGNCANYDDIKKECVYTLFSTGEEIHEQHEPTDKACEDWERPVDTLEQRHQQLQQVALRMFQKLDVRTNYKDDELDGIESELERLGVFDD